MELECRQEKRTCTTLLESLRMLKEEWQKANRSKAKLRAYDEKRMLLHRMPMESNEI